MDLLLTRIFSGLTDGSIYAMVALALVVVFRSSSTINFAQCEFALFSCFVAWWLVGNGVAPIIGLIAACAVGFVTCAVAEVTLFRPVRRRNEDAVLIVALGLFIGLNGLDGWIWGPQDKLFPKILPNGDSSYVAIAGARLHYDSLVLWAVLALVVLALVALLNGTSLGLKMRAVASNADSAALSGVHVGRILTTSWGLAGMIASLAGVLLIPMLPPNHLTLSGFFSVLIFASAAALLGGLDSIRGAVVGGLLLGVSASLISGYIPAIGQALQLTVVLLIIVGVLLLRPTGIFGAKQTVRV